MKREELGLLNLTPEWTPYDTIYFISYDSLENRYFTRLSEQEKEKSNHIGEYWTPNQSGITKKSKILYYDISNGEKKLTDEIDIYQKELSKLTVIQLEIIYSYSKDSLSSLIDTTATKFANERRRHIRDSLNSFTDRSKPYLCGTAYNEIFTNLTKDIPSYNIPHVISIDSARSILINWSKSRD